MIVNVSKRLKHRLERVLSLERLWLFEVKFMVHNLVHLLFMLLNQPRILQLVLFLVRCFLQACRLHVQFVDDVLKIVQLDALAHRTCESCFFWITLLLAIIQVVKVPLEQVVDKIMLDVLEWLKSPVTDLEVILVQLIEMIVKICVSNGLRQLLLNLDRVKILLVLPLLELHVRLVFQRCLQVHHVLTNQSLHLHGVEVLLIGDHVSDSCLCVLQLFELDEEHVVESLEVLSGVVNCHPSPQLVEQCFDTAVQLCAESLNRFIVFLIDSGVLFKPVLRV